MREAVVSRRQFLRYSGAGAVATLATSLGVEDVARAASVSPLPAGTPILVIVTLYGGNDGLNTVVPYEDAAYASARPGISLSGAQVLPLTDGLALNGSMTGLKSLWDHQQVAIVRGVSYPNPSHSHFSSMAIWQSGSPVDQVASGWIGRWLDGQSHDPMRAIGLGAVVPPLLAGDRQVGSMLPLGGLAVPSGSLAAQCEIMSGRSTSDSTLSAAAATSIGDLFRISSAVTPALAGAPPASGNVLAQQLDVVAKLIAINAPTRVWSVALGGFDTHADELTEQNALLGELSDAVSGFMTQIGATPRAKDVVVLVYSEFGRRVGANASQGTDHGTSAPVFVVGQRVNGGFYGDEPSLTQLVDGDLAVTTDFRDVYAGLLHDVIGVDPASVLNNWSSRLSVVAPT